MKPSKPVTQSPKKNGRCSTWYRPTGLTGNLGCAPGDEKVFLALPHPAQADVLAVERREVLLADGADVGHVLVALLAQRALIGAALEAGRNLVAAAGANQFLFRHRSVLHIVNPYFYQLPLSVHATV